MKKSFLKALVPLMMVFMVVSCGGGKDPTPTQPGEPTPTSSAQPATPTPSSQTPTKPATPSSEPTPSVQPSTPTGQSGKVKSDTLYARKVENLADDFIMGMDASSVIAEEASGVKYYNFNGEEEDVFKILADNGINYIRVRIWNDPYDENGNGYGGGNNDVAKAVEIGKRATKYGMKLLVDFHYSDFWADPAKQYAPKAWAEYLKIKNAQDMYFSIADALYEFTYNSLNRLKEADVDVGMVQIGNETNGGYMAGIRNRMDFFAGLITMGNMAVKEVYPNALTAVHFANPEKTQNYLNWAAQLKKFDAEYDVFGTSYYPYWHGTLENLNYVLDTIATTYNKKVMVMETSYAFDTRDTDFHTNTIGATSGYDVRSYPFTIAGQANHINNVIDVVAHTTNGIGVCYWEGTWISVGTNSWEDNHAKWEQYGSGWASSYAADYDPDDAGKWPGGCAVENQAFFDEHGKPLESLKIWNLVRYGNDAPRYIDGIEDAQVSHYTDETFELPETVNVIYNDNSKDAIPVTWDEFDIDAAKAAGNARYEINGVAEDGSPVRCILVMLEYNFVQNWSFEDENLEPWVVNNLSEVGFNKDYYKAEVTTENVQTGKNAFAFWTKNADTCKFEIEQDITSYLRSGGEYKFQVSFTGGTTGTANPDKMNVYAYVKINGVVANQKAGSITKWSEWHDCLITGIQVEEGDTVVVGAHVESSEAGFWGSVEDCMFNYVG